MIYREESLTNKNRDGALGLLLSLLLASQVAWVFSTRVERPLVQARLSLQNQILAGDAAEPYRFRTLVPWVASSLEAFVGEFGLDIFQAHQFVFLVMNGIVITTILWMTWAYLGVASLMIKTLSISLLASSFHVALYDHAYQPWSILELLFIVGAYLCVKHDKYWALPAIALVATLNRETGVLLPLMVGVFVLLTQRKLLHRKRVAWIIVAQLVTVLAFFGSRGLIGPGGRDISLEQVFNVNTSPQGLALFAMNLLLMFGLYFILMWGGGVSRASKHLLLSLAPLVPLVMVFGIWHEVRLLIPFAWAAAVAVGGIKTNGRDRFDAN